MSLALIAILMIAACFVLVLSKKVHMIIPFIVIPIIFALVAGFSLSEVSSFVVDGVSSTNNAVLLILFSVAYFSILSETGMFDIIVNRITKLTKNNIYVVLLCTVLVAMIGHLDGAYNTTYLIAIPTLLPLYKKLHIDSRILMLLTVMGATVMCVAPWGASIVQLTPFAGVEANVLSQRLLPFAGVAFVLAVVSALMFGFSASKQNKNIVLSSGTADAEKELDFSDKPNARPKLFAVNLIIFVASIVCLFLVKIQVYIIFMLFTSLTLIINYRDVKDQGALIRKYSATMLAPALLFMSIGVMVGIMQGTGMVEAVIDVVLNAIPESMARYTHVIFGLLLVPIYLVLPYQVMLPIYPILTGIGQSLGISPVSIMMVFALQYGTACSPLVAATNLGSELAGVNVIDHMKFSAPRCWLCSAILVLAMVISGAAFL